MARAPAGRTCPCSCWATVQPAGGRRRVPGLVVHWAPGFATLDRSTATGSAPAVPGPADPGPAHGGRRPPGLEWAVGVPGSVGGAVRMNAGGHGSDTAATLVPYRGRPGRRHRRPAARRPTWPPATGNVGPAAEVVVSGPTSSRPGDPEAERRPSPRSCAGAGPTSPAGPTPVRCSPPPGRLGRPAGRGLRTEGAPDRHGGGVAEARRFHPGGSRGSSADDVLAADRARAHPGVAR